MEILLIIAIVWAVGGLYANYLVKHMTKALPMLTLKILAVIAMMLESWIGVLAFYLTYKRNQY